MLFKVKLLAMLLQERIKILIMMMIEINIFFLILREFSFLLMYTTLFYVSIIYLVNKLLYITHQLYAIINYFLKGANPTKVSHNLISKPWGHILRR